MSAHNKSLQAQIISAIKYFKSEFSINYQQWKQHQKGHPQFQKHLNTIQYTLSSQNYSSLKGKIFDQLIIKLRFITKNQSFLQHFQVFLLEKLINIIVRELANLYRLKDIYSPKPIANMVSRNQMKKQVWERYVILLDCLTSILRYCFITTLTHQKQQQQDSSQMSHKFNNQMIIKSSSQTPKQEISSKAFVAFVLQILSQKLDEIFKYKIMPEIKPYPEIFSVLAEGFLNFRGGSKVLELIGDILNKLVFHNQNNIWDFSLSSSKGNSMEMLEKLNKDVIEVLAQGEHKKQGIDKLIQQKAKNQENKKAVQQAPFSQISKQRLLLFLQNLLIKVGSSQVNRQSPNYTQSLSLMQGQVLQSGNKKVKLRKFINELMVTVEKGCLQIVFQEDYDSQHTINTRGNLSELDEKILYNLVVLIIEFMDNEQERQYEQIQQNKYNHFQSSLITLLSLNTTSHSIISSMRTKVHHLFTQKFKLLLNKNKTISSTKTLLLKQLSKLIKFINFESLSYDDFQNTICLKLKELFRPNEQQLNKPMIIAIDQKSNIDGRMNGQAIPLTDLGSHHSFATYPITLSALCESLKFQQSRHVLDEVKLFNWFQHEQVNLREFRKMITNMDLRSRLQLLEYFINDLLKSKLQQTTQFYTISMSLTQFYHLLINYFFIDTIINPNSQGLDIPKPSQNLLNINSYKTHQQLYKKSLIPKLQTVYLLITNNSDLKRLLISSKEEELLLFWNLRILYSISKFFLSLETTGLQTNRDNCSQNNKLQILYKKAIIAQNLILNLSHSTYLLKLLITSYLIEFSAPFTIHQALKPLQSTLIHRNAGSSINNKLCNLQFMKNLIQISILTPKSAQQLAQIYLSKSFITNPQANTVISLIFKNLTPQTMRKCILSIRNWPIIFLIKHNLELLNNQPLLSQPQEQLFHANDGDNVTVSNALGVIVLELGQKWTAELQFTNPRKQILIDAMINLIAVNDKLIFWKRFFFESLLVKLCSILNEIDTYATGGDSSNGNKALAPQHQQKGRRHTLYERIHTKISTLINTIPVQYYRYSTQINSQIQKNLQTLKYIVEKQHMHLKRQCFVYQRYDKYLDNYKQSNSILDKIDAGLKHKQEEIKSQNYQSAQNEQQ